MRISIHAPSRERHTGMIAPFGSRLFQSTLPRGSDSNALECKRLGIISIHAPLRERPAIGADFFSQHSISIHAPLRERRFLLRWKQLYLILMLYFNPRSLAGATLFFFHYFLPQCDISIHAPSRKRQGVGVEWW